jgi:hypothetical protein
MDFLDDGVHTITLVWNKDNPREVEKARRIFMEYLEKGLIAFKVTPDDKKIQVRSFDPTYGTIILARLVEGG